MDRWGLLACDVGEGRAVAAVTVAGDGLSIDGDEALLVAGPCAWAGEQDERPVLVEPDWGSRVLRLHPLRWLGDERSCVVWSAPGSRQVLVWSRMKGPVVYDLDSRDTVTALDVRPGRTGVAAAGDGVVWLLSQSRAPGTLLGVDTTSWQVVQSWPITGHGLSGDGAGRNALIWQAGSSGRVLDLQAGEVVRQVDLSTVSEVAPVLLTDGRVVVWDHSSGFDVLDPPDP